MASDTQKTHPFHIINPSPWPLLTSLAVLLLGLGFVFYMHGERFGGFILCLGTGFLLACMAGWFRDVTHEAHHEDDHTKPVQVGLRVGFLVFILTELMFFFAFFWAYFNASLFPSDVIGAIWPPASIKTLDPFRLPYLNTLLLLLSASSLTWAHGALEHDFDKKTVKAGLLITILLALTFMGVQTLEYSHASFKLSDGIYGSNFYLLTGFHGLHVLIGTIFLAVCYFRMHQFKQEQHVGFEAAAWYWHFVDVVWLFLFVFIYWFGQ